VTEQTRAVLARRREAVGRVFAGQAGYDEVLAFHAEDVVWLSGGGVHVGHDAARAHQAERMARIAPEALSGTRVIREAVHGEYGFVMFKTDLMPFGTDSYRVVDGKVVFHSNALYLPRP
jgi:hypothetical protein